MSSGKRKRSSVDPKQSAYNAFMSSLKQVPIDEPEEEELSGIDLITALVNGTAEVTDSGEILTGDALEHEAGAAEAEKQGTVDIGGTRTKSKSEMRESESAYAKANDPISEEEPLDEEPSSNPEAVPLPEARKLDHPETKEGNTRSTTGEKRDKRKTEDLQAHEKAKPEEDDSPAIELSELTDLLEGYALGNEASVEKLALYEEGDDADIDWEETPLEGRFHYPDAAARRAHQTELPTTAEMGGFFSMYVDLEDSNGPSDNDVPFDPKSPFAFILDNREIPPHEQQPEPHEQSYVSRAGAMPDYAGQSSADAVESEELAEEVRYGRLLEPDEDGLDVQVARDRNYFASEQTPHVAFRVSGPYSDDGIATMQMAVASRGVGGYSVERLLRAKALKVTGASLFGMLSQDQTICSIEWDAYKGLLEASTATIHGVGALSEVAFASFGKEVWDRVQRLGEVDRRFTESLEMDSDEDFTCMLPEMKIINAVLDIEYMNKLWTLSLGRASGDVELSWDEYDDDRGHRGLVKKAVILFSAALTPFVLRIGQDGAGREAKRNTAQKLGKWAKERIAKDAMAPFSIDSRGQVKTLMT